MVDDGYFIPAFQARHLTGTHDISWSESWSILKGQSWFNFWRRDISLAKQSCCFAHGLSIALCSSGRLWMFNQFCKLTTNCQMTTALISGVFFLFRLFSVCKPAVSLGLDRQLLTQELKNHPPTRRGNLVMSTCLEETWRLRNKRYASEYSYDWRGCIKKPHKEWYMMQISTSFQVKRLPLFHDILCLQNFHMLRFRLMNTTAWTISIQNMSCDERKAL